MNDMLTKIFHDISTFNQIQRQGFSSAIFIKLQLYYLH